jgi:hypothetical protein
MLDLQPLLLQQSQRQNNTPPVIQRDQDTLSSLDPIWRIFSNNWLIRSPYLQQRLQQCNIKT